MTTSRIYAYRWPARLVSHKPFAAEKYFITSACIWQVFFQKNRIFLFYFLRTVFWHIFCAFCILRSTFLRGKLPRLSGCTGMGRFIQKDPLRQGPAGFDGEGHSLLFLFQLFFQPIPGSDVDGGVHLIQNHAGLCAVGLPDVLHLGGIYRHLGTGTGLVGPQEFQSRRWR